MLDALLRREHDPVRPQVDGAGVQVFHQAGLEQYDGQVPIAHALFPGVREHLQLVRIYALPVALGELVYDLLDHARRQEQGRGAIQQDAPPILHVKIYVQDGLIQHGGLLLGEAGLHGKVGFGKIQCAFIIHGV